MSAVKAPVMRYHGAKFRLAPWVMQFFPNHYTYVEPFGGAAGVLLQKPRSMSEVYNDLDGEVVNVFRVLRDLDLAAELERLLRLTPYARDEFAQSYDPIDDPVEQARRTLTRAHMGFGSAGVTKQITGFRIDSAREYGTAAHLWARYPAHVSAFTERFQSVVIENKDALEVIDNHARENTLFYVDPPYMAETRNTSGHRSYRHELTDSDHLGLLDRLKQAKGFVVLSGYDTEIYNEQLEGWAKRSTPARISAGRGTAVRTECVWLNPRCAENQGQFNLDL